MIYVITNNEVTDRAAYLPLAKDFAEESVHDRGCHEMHVYADTEQKNKVVFISLWDSKEDFLAHVQGPTFAKHIPGMSIYYVSGTDTFLEEV